MADLREVFEMVTKQTDPDVDSWREQERRQRRAARNRKISAIALVAALVIGVVTVVLLDRSDHLVNPPASGGPTTSVRVGSWFILDMDAGTKTAFAVPRSTAGSFDYSPDGSQIAYTAVDEQSRREVFVMNADGSNDHQLTRGVPAFVSDWSPDGSMIAFNRIAPDSSQEIFLLDLSDGSTTRLTHEPRHAIFDSPEAWAPDGRSLLFIERDAGDPYYMARTIDIATGQTRTIAKDVSTPSLSPDGTQIAFDAYHVKSRTPRLSLMNSDGTGRRVITRTVYSGGWEAWSPDGRQIAFVRNDPHGILSTYLYDTTTGKIGFVANGSIEGGGWVDAHSLLIQTT